MYRGLVHRVVSSVVIIAALVPVLFLGSCSTVETDNEMMELIQTVAKSCEVDLKYAFVRDCPPLRRLEEQVRNKPVPLVVGTIATALNDDNRKVQVVACKLLYGEIKDNRHKLRENAERFNDTVVERLIQGVASIRDYVAMYAVASTVYTATLTEHEDSLFDMLASHPQQVVRTEAYPKTMTYGRIRVLDTLKEIAETSEEDGELELVKAALRAPLNMYDYNEEEKQAVAQWIEPYLEHKNSTFVYIAGKVLYNKCGGQYIGRVLDLFENYLDRSGGQLEYPFKYLLDHTYNAEESSGQEERKQELRARVRK